MNTSFGICAPGTPNSRCRGRAHRSRSRGGLGSVWDLLVRSQQREGGAPGAQIPKEVCIGIYMGPVKWDLKGISMGSPTPFYEQSRRSFLKGTSSDIMPRFMSVSGAV